MSPVKQKALERVYSLPENISKSDLNSLTNDLNELWNHASRSPKYWTTSNYIDPAKNYHVPLSELSLSRLLQLASEKGSFTLVHGHFRSGKTSHLVALEQSLLTFYTVIPYH